MTRPLTGVSYLQFQRSDGTGVGNVYPPWIGDSVWTNANRGWVPLVSAWGEVGVLETALDTYAFGVVGGSSGTFTPAATRNTPGTISAGAGAYTYLIERAIARNKGVILRIAAGHWSPPDWYTTGGVPDAGLTVYTDIAGTQTSPASGSWTLNVESSAAFNPGGGTATCDGQTITYTGTSGLSLTGCTGGYSHTYLDGDHIGTGAAYAMPVIYHPNYRLRLSAFASALRAWLTTPRAAVVAAIILDGASDGGTEWPVSLETKGWDSTTHLGGNASQSYANVDTYGSLAHDAAGIQVGSPGCAIPNLPSPAGSYATGNVAAYLTWLQAAYLEQWKWSRAMMEGLFPDVLCMMSMGQIWADAAAAEKAWTDPAQHGYFSGGNSRTRGGMRTDWQMGPGMLGFGNDGSARQAITDDATTLRNIRRNGGSYAIQSADTSSGVFFPQDGVTLINGFVWPTNQFSSTGSYTYGITNDLIPNWADAVFFEAPDACFTTPHAAANTALQAYSAAMQAYVPTPPFFTLPVLTLEASFNDNPTSGSPVWTDITYALRACQSARGRQINMPGGTAFDVGTATIILDNRNGDFDPTFTGSPYYPHVIPLVRIRLRATWNSITEPVFDMFADGWPSTYDIGNTDEYVTVTLGDAMALLADDNYFPGTDAPSERTDLRIGRLLTGLGLGSLPQSLDTGAGHVTAEPQINVNGLSHIQDVELSEYGAFYSARNGTITFESRYHRAFASSQGTFGDAGGSEVPYTTLSPSDDKSTLVNDAQVTDSLGVAFKYTDAASRTKYSQRSTQISNLTDTPNEGFDQAVWVVLTQKDHTWRVPLMQFMPQRGTTAQRNAQYAQALGREISDLITIKRRPPSGNVINEDVFIERIEHDITPQTWTTRFGVSPKRLTNTSFGILNDATKGKLDSTMVLAY